MIKVFAVLLVFLSAFAFSSNVGVWKEIEQHNPPSQRGFHACDIMHNKLYVYGGRTGLAGYDNTLHIFDLESKTWEHPKVPFSPPNQRAQVMSQHTVTQMRNKLYIFGGQTGFFSTSNELYVYDPYSETMYQVNVEGEKPAARYSHSAVAISNSKILVYGGRDGSTFYDDVWIFDASSNKWSKQETLMIDGRNPLALEAHKAILYHGEMIVLGGTTSSEYISDIYVLNLDTWKWRKLTNNIGDNVPFKPRGYHSVELIGRFVYVFGGLDSNDVLNDLKILDLNSNEWINQQPEGSYPARQGHCSVVYNGNIFMFGGSQNWKTTFNDVYVLETMEASFSISKPQRTIDYSGIDLSERIDGAILTANILLSQDEKNETDFDAETELSKLLKSDTDENEFQDLPDRINMWNNIATLFRNLLNAKHDLRNITVRHEHEIQGVKDKLDSFKYLKEKLISLTTELQRKIEDLKIVENSFTSEVRRTHELRQSLDQISIDIKDTEIYITDNKTKLSTYERESKVLEERKNSLHSHLERINTVLRDDIQREYEQREKFLQEQLKQLDEQITRVSQDIKRLNQRLEDTRKDSQKYDQKMNQLRQLQKEVEQLKEIYYNAKKYHENFMSSKKQIIEELKILDIKAESTTDCGNIKEEDFMDKIDKLLEDNQRKLAAKKSTEGAMLEQLTDDLRQRKAKLQELKDKEARDKNEIFRIQEKIVNKEREIKRSMQDKERVEAEFKSTKESLDSIDFDKGKIEERIKLLEERYNSLKTNQKNRTEELRLQEDREENARRQLDEMKSKLEEKFETLISLSKQCKHHSTMIEEMRRNIKTSKSAYEAERGTIVSARNRLDEYLKKVDRQWQEKYDKLYQENQLLKQKLEEFEKKQKDSNTPTPSPTPSPTPTPQSTTEKKEEGRSKVTQHENADHKHSI